MICIFFITSADSGIFIMNSISSVENKPSPVWQKIFLGIALAGISLLLLNLGGLQALQTMTLITALPFAAIITLFCYSLFVALHIDKRYHSTDDSHSIAQWTVAIGSQNCSV